MNRKARRADKSRAPDVAEVHYTRGIALDRQGRLEEALAAFGAATAARAGYLEAHCGVAMTLAKLGRREEAVAAYGQALALQPRFPGALNNLAILLLALGRPAEAVAACHQAVAIDPGVPESHYNLGNALRECGRLDAAAVAFRQAITLRPDNAEAYIALGNVLLLHNQGDDAHVLFRHAYRLRPLSRRPAAMQPPDFSVLLLTVPGIANTPSDYLLSRTSYDSNVLALMGGVEYDPAQLRKSGDVVVNLISDIDWSRALLPQVIALVDRLGRPVLNHPRKILGTGREQIAQRLAGIPHCRVPKTLRFSGADLAPAKLPPNLAGFATPLLVRVCGSHGGDDFEKLASLDAVAAFVSRKAEADYYVSEYVPYESADGYFRKYRLIFVDGRILPYHLAISDQWKVHHFRTDMANQEWMRAEEEAFVSMPDDVFAPRHWQALHAIQAVVGLDYFGIDCAIDRSGDLVVFEVNATMLVHGETGAFAYKQPYIARIKQAFDTMLAKAVRP